MLSPPKPVVLVAAHVSNRPSGRFAAPVAISGHSIKSPQRPRLIFSVIGCAAPSSGGISNGCSSLANSNARSSPSSVSRKARYSSRSLAPSGFVSESLVSIGSVALLSVKLPSLALSHAVRTIGSNSVAIIILSRMNTPRSCGTGVCALRTHM